MEGYAFSELDLISKAQGVREIILSATVSYGFNAPPDRDILDILDNAVMSQIGRFGFKNLNIPEITLALQLNMQTDLPLPDGIDIEPIEPSGNFFNVNFLSKVLKNYMVVRTLLDKKLKNMIDGTESK